MLFCDTKREHLQSIQFYRKYLREMRCHDIVVWLANEVRLNPKRFLSVNFTHFFAKWTVNKLATISTKVDGIWSKGTWCKVKGCIYRLSTSTHWKEFSKYRCNSNGKSRYLPLCGDTWKTFSGACFSGVGSPTLPLFNKILFPLEMEVNLIELHLVFWHILE